MNYLTLVTLGHVDHGKTALVGALTGAETDRLPEEKDRGISIALGHAHLACDGGVLAFIDAPGHERFIRTMIAGTSGATAALLVVDVREALRPQSYEHVHIARYLGVKNFVVALAKCDGVPESVRGAVVDEVTQWLASVGIAAKAIVYTSATAGEGIETLRAELAALLQRTHDGMPSHPPFLPIDRAFSMKGHGSVATGTLHGGTIGLKDTLEALPDGVRVPVRGIQCHGNDVDEAHPGRRVAVNVRLPQGLELSRGMVLAAPDCFAPSRLFDGWLDVLRDAHDPIHHDQSVHLLFGASEVMARVRLLEGAELAPGRGGYVQFVCDRLAVAHRGLPFVIRGGAPLTTLGGGTLLAPAFRKVRAQERTAAIALLEALRSGNTERVLGLAAAQAGVRGIGERELQRRLGIQPEELADPTRFAGVRRVQGRWFDGASVAQAEGMLMDELTQWHRRHPERQGMPTAQWGTDLDDALRHYLHERLRARKRVRMGGGRVVLAGKSSHEAVPKELLTTVEGAFREGGSTPPHVLDVVGDHAGSRRALRALVNEGVLVAIYVRNKPRTFEQSRVFHRDSVLRAWRAIVVAVGGGAEFDTQEAKDALGVSRKHLIPLLEYFDEQGWTARSEGGRAITQKGIQAAIGLTQPAPLP